MQDGEYQQNKTEATVRCLCDFAVFVPERNSGVPDVHRLLQRGGPAQCPDGDGQLCPEHDPGGVPVHEGVPACAQWTTKPLCECVCVGRWGCCLCSVDNSATQ